MYKNILIATDGSDLAGKGMDQGIALAKALGSKVTVVTVTEPYPFYVASSAGWSPSATEIDAYMQGQKEVATHVLDAAAKLAASAGVDVAVRHVPDRWPAEAILETATSDRCDLIVMASHGRRGLGRILLGSQTAHVLAQSAIPVLVVR